MLRTTPRDATSERDRAPSDQPVLELVRVGKAFGAVEAVADVSMSVAAGEILSILGPSGCGKTTTMRMIAGLETPTSGDIRVNGESILGVPPHRRGIGLVFQSLAIFPHMSVRENVAFGLRMKGMPKDEISGRVERTLEMVQLPFAQFADRRPGQLSGGQLQRVALARTIVTEPALVLFDEPMAALDRRLRDHMASELRAIQKALGIAAIYVTHDQETASVMSDRLAIMDAGRLVQIGSPVAVYQRPADRFVAEFLGDVNDLRATSAGAAVAVAGAMLAVAVNAGPVGESVRVLIRPDDVRLAAAADLGDGLRGRIEDIQFASGLYRWRLTLPDGQTLLVRTPAHAEGLSVGDDVALSVDASRVTVFER